MEKRIPARVPSKTRAELDDDAENGQTSATGTNNSKYNAGAGQTDGTPPPMYRAWIQTHTPAPENLRWENLTIGRCNRCIRIIVSTLITLVLLLGTIGCSIIVKNQSLKMSRNYPSVDCEALRLGQPNEVITQEAALLDEMKLTRLNSTFFVPNNVKPRHMQTRKRK